MTIELILLLANDPLPWYDDDPTQWYHLQTNEGRTILVDGTPDDADLRPTINLLLAAPALFAACEASLAFIDGLSMPTGGWPLELCDKLNVAGPALRAALAKARREAVQDA